MSVFAVGRARATAGLATGLLLLLFSASVFAEDNSVCANAETTVDMRACLNQAYDRADADLNAVWKKVMASLANADYMPAKERKAWKEELLTSQRAWITFKEHDCDAVGFEWWGGTGASGAILSCLLDHTTARTQNLKARYLDN